MAIRFEKYNFIYSVKDIEIRYPGGYNAFKNKYGMTLSCWHDGIFVRLGGDPVFLPDNIMDDLKHYGIIELSDERLNDKNIFSYPIDAIKKKQMPNFIWTRQMPDAPMEFSDGWFSQGGFSYSSYSVWAKVNTALVLNNDPSVLLSYLSSQNVVEEIMFEGLKYPSQEYTPEIISELNKKEIFVFGSNLEGKHFGGAARLAYKKFGAIIGQGVGIQGKSYAIPTMHGGPAMIKPYVDEFIKFAQEHPELKFLVTKIGCGIAGFKVHEIAPLFKKAVDIPNVILPREFYECIL